VIGGDKLGGGVSQWLSAAICCISALALGASLQLAPASAAAAYVRRGGERRRNIAIKKEKKRSCVLWK